MKRLLFLGCILVALTKPNTILATDNPLSRPNNYFGIHIINEHDIDAAAEMVNGSGGQWGYVTFVIREDERDIGRWSLVFEKLKQQKLIPIVRIATKSKNGIWLKPDINDAQEWANFLNKLPWPTQNRYVVLFNEPNHAKEWGGQINPDNYAKVARRFWEKFKRASVDFFILPAALDTAAKNSPQTKDAVDFWQEMYVSDNLIFTIFDGYNSHSYPNPGFCGNPTDSGRNSIRSFEWETSYLERYYLQSKTQIFITETGWGCNIAGTQISEFYKYAFENIWTDKRLVAVTPFLLNYTQTPFQKFSWIDTAGNKKPYYELVKNIQKIKGEPAIL